MHRPLTAADIASAGPLRRLGATVSLFDSVSSTNDWLRQEAPRRPDGAIAVAERQTAGRGRQGRSWMSPRGASVLLSVLLIEQNESALPPLASTAAALAASEAIEAATGIDARIRWPNDLVVNARKLGGVLVETTPLDPRRLAVVVGVGINCLQHAGHFPPELRQRAASLEMESHHAVDRARVAAMLVRRLDDRITTATSPGGPAALLSAWRGRCDDWGARATLLRDGRTYNGSILDVTESGDLIVQLDEGRRECFEAARTTRQW